MSPVTPGEPTSGVSVLQNHVQWDWPDDPAGQRHQWLRAAEPVQPAGQAAAGRAGRRTGRKGPRAAGESAQQAAQRRHPGAPTQEAAGGQVCRAAGHDGRAGVRITHLQTYFHI